MKKNVNKLSLMRSKKRVISILLVLAIIFSMLPTVVLASGGYTADFVVTDESGTAVRGAEITIGSDTQTTNFEGKAQFFLQNGDYSYSVSSVGRLDVTDNTISISDSNITENVELSIDPTGATVTIGSHVTDNLRNEITSFITNHSLENVDITSLTVTGGAISVTDCINIANVPNSNNDLRNTLKKVDFSGTSFVGNKYPSMSLTALSEVILPESVTEIDGSAFWECTYLESINIPQNVTKIGNSAFSGCSSLKHITLPSSVTQIGVGAFQNCTSLTSITLPPDVANIEDYTFMNCNALNSVTLPTNATSIADSAFRDCTHLTTITFPSEITDIGDWAFQGCSLLEKVIFPSGIKKIGSLAFTDCPKLADITLPATVPPTADNSSFRGVPNEALVHVPGGSYSAYHDYDDISTEDCYWCGLYIDDPTKVPVISEAGVQRISDSAAHISFNMDDKLATFYYAVVNEGDPQPVIDTSGPGTGISEFEQCEINVTTLTPGVKDCYIVAKKNGVLSNLLKVKIYAYAVPFDMVISNHKAGSLEQEMNAYLESINCSGAMPFIRTLKVTGGALNAADQDYLGLSMMNWANLTKIDFSGTAFEYNKANDNVMEEGLFAGIVNCGTIILPETVAAISDYAFAGCMSLENITLPSSISAIGIGAFRDCRGLAAITIPASVATIGEYALNDCDSLSYIKMNSSTPPTVGEYAFEGIPTGAVQVPAGCASAYKAVDDGDTTDNMWYGLTVIDEGVTGKIITRVEEINKIVPWGTSIADVGLPDKVEVSLSDGSTIKVDTEWDNGQPEYDGNKDGGYFFTGTLKNLPSGINNDIGKTAEAYVVVDTLKSAKLSPAAFSFDLDAPKDIVSQITWNNAGVVRNVVYNSGAGQADIKHTLNGNTLSISKDDMLALNPKEGTSIQFEIFFDKGDSTKFTVDVFKGYHPGTDASLSSLKMHGFDYPGFNPGKYSYELILPQGVTPGDIYSLIEATPKDPKAKVVITPAATLPGCTTIEVTAENGITKLTYTINFKASAYTVTFDKNGGDTEANPSSKTAAAGVSLDNLPTAPTRSGYTFNGWNTKQDGSGTSFTATTPVTANITVYAQWTVNATNGGGGGSSGNTPTNANTNSTPSTSVTTNAGNNSSGVTSSITTEAKTDSNGKAAATVSEGQVKEAVSKAVAEAAKKGKGTEAKVEIKVNTSADVKTVETSLPKSAVATVADNKTDALTIVTPAANVTFDKTAINTILNEATADIKITVSKVETTSLPRETQEAAGDRPVYNFSVTSGGKTISQFGGNVTVSVPYTPKAGEDINAIVIYYINAEGKLELVNNCVYDPSIGAITFKTNHFSLYTVGYNKVIFKDVTANAWYGKAVGFVAAREITTGTGNGNYSPNAQLTRAEFLVMVMKAYGIKPDERITDNFADSGNTYYTGYLAAAKRLGVTAGIGNNMFEPNKKITRQEMAALLYNLLKQLGELPTITTGKTLDSYSDTKDVATWAKDAMGFLVEAGTVGGSSGKLLPESKTTRAEMAQVLYNLLSK